MPNVTNHKHKFKHNENFYTDIRSNLSNYVDWQITSLYYSLLHLINGYHAKYYPNEKIGSPELLSTFVFSHFQIFSSRFDDLKDECWQARYKDCTDCSSREERLLKIHKPFFDNFKKIAEKLL